MPRTRVSERTRWEQLANAVIELGQNVKLLEERVKALESHSIGTFFSKVEEHAQS